MVSYVISMGCPSRCEIIPPVRSRLLGVPALRIARWKHRRASCPLRGSLPSWLGASRVVGGPVPAPIVPWQHTPLPRYPKATLDGADHGHIVAGNEGKCHASACGAAGATDTMDIGFRRVRHVVVNDVRNARHINAACRDVCSYQDLKRPCSEAIDGGLTLTLRQVALQRRSAIAGVGQLLGYTLGTLFRARKDKDRRQISVT